MTDQEILNFKNETKQLSIEELQKLHSDLQCKMSNMLLQSDLTMKIAVVEMVLQEELEKEQKDE